MDDHRTPLKTRHRFADFLFWNVSAAVPVLTACIGIGRVSIAGLIFYLAVFVFLLGIVYKFYCTHCPHYVEGQGVTRCMFFWGLPKFFPARPGPLNRLEKTASIAAPVVLLLMPLLWLVKQPGFLAIYVLSTASLLAGIRRHECGRCIFFDCPSNRVPAEQRNEEASSSAESVPSKGAQE